MDNIWCIDWLGCFVDYENRQTTRDDFKYCCRYNWCGSRRLDHESFWKNRGNRIQFHKLFGRFAWSGIINMDCTGAWNNEKKINCFNIKLKPQVSAAYFHAILERAKVIIAQVARLLTILKSGNEPKIIKYSRIPNPIPKTIIIKPSSI